MKTLTVQDNPDLLKDAMTLLKSDFVALYVAQGYDRKETEMAWHNLRTSAAGHEFRKNLGSPSINKATSFIGNMEEEVATRVKKKRGRPAKQK